MKARKRGDQSSHDSELTAKLKALQLTSIADQWPEAAAEAERDGWSFAQFLLKLAGQELEDRRQRKVERLLKASNLLRAKTLATLKLEKLAAPVRRVLPTLLDGAFVRRAENVLAFGLPGRGKTHLACAIGHELVQRGFSVLFIPTVKLVQRLLKAKRDLTLERYLARLDRFAVIIADDIGYVQHDRDEMEVLFTFLAERYERKSVIITSNLVFSEWGKIFKDEMTAAAAIDRLVHHSTILALTGPSIRNEDAKGRGTATDDDTSDNDSVDEDEEDDDAGESPATPESGS